MIKTSQFSQATDPMASMMDPMGSAETMPMADPYATGEMGEPLADSGQEKKYKGLESPEDIFTDYNVTQAFENEEDTESIVQDIWSLYGGNEIGTDSDDGKIGQWPEEEPENMSKEDIETMHKITEDKRWERLAEGLTIMDVFKGGQEEIKNKISGYTTSLGLTQKAQPATAADKVSWYKIANGSKRNHS